MTHFYVIRQGPFRSCGVYFCGFLDGDEVWSTSQARGKRWCPKDKEFCELVAVGLNEEARVVRVKATQLESAAEEKKNG